MTILPATVSGGISTKGGSQFELNYFDSGCPYIFIHIIAFRPVAGRGRLSNKGSRFTFELIFELDNSDFASIDSYIYNL